MVTAYSAMRRAMTAAAILLASASAAGAQPGPEPIDVGRSVEAEISPSLPRLAGTPFRTFRFDAREGTRYEVTATSDSFEPEIRVGRSIGGITDYLATATGQGMDAGAILEIDAPSTEALVITVRPLEGDGGPFRLMVREATSGEPRPLPLGRPTAGVVGASAESFHAFSGSVGSEVEITARSTDFDTYLEVGRITGGAFIALESDDDSAGRTDSRVYFIPPATGEYMARVTAYGGDGGGAYAIVMTPPIELPPPTPLTAGTRASGELSAASPASDDLSSFADWSVTALRGERFRIDLQSRDFDTYLEVGRMEGRHFVEIASNDDESGDELGATDSRVVLIAREGGEYIIRARPLSGDESGAYTLLATPLEPVRIDPLGGALTLGSPATGTLTDTDAILDDGAPYQEWRIGIPSPGTYMFLLESSDFDTYLILGSTSDGEFEEWNSNDDWSGSANRTDSRIVHTFAEAGEYILRVRPFSEEVSGDYTLTATAGSSEPGGGRLEVGGSVSAALSADDARVDDSPFHEWLIELDAGTRTTITLESDDFDTFLAIGRGDDGSFRELGANDDGPNGTNSMLEFMAPADGEYIIRVRPFFGEDAGEYRLSVSPR